MRISDWSSDVCSSDLAGETIGVDIGESLRLGRGAQCREIQIGRRVEAVERIDAGIAEGVEPTDMTVAGPRRRLAAGDLDREQAILADIRGRRVEGLAVGRGTQPDRKHVERRTSVP